MVHQLREMCRTIKHRGPDDEGVDIQGHVGLGMRRLAVIDIKDGKQPIYNEDRSIRIVFNGEIYNFRRLKEALISRGHVFYTRSDTEVIVHAYEEYGDRFPECLNGMFAFAIHDKRRGRLILVRDHLGIKPLFFFIDPKQLIWGSEIKAILASKMIDRRLNVGALAEFLTFEYVPGDKTLFSSIHKLKPGCMLDVNLNTAQWRVKEYWDIGKEDDSFSNRSEEWIEAIDAKIKLAVNRQMVSDVPLGAFLSGGVDSSLVVSSMGKVNTFSIGFADPSYNELEWARKVADHLSVNHKDDIIHPDIIQLFDHLMYFMDDPIGDFSIFPTYLVSKHARKDVTVSLSGDGGDELFGGYETYIADQKARQYEHLPLSLRKKLIEPLIKRLRPRPQKKGLINKTIRFVEGMDYPAEIGHVRWRIFLSDIMRHKLFTPTAHSCIEEPVDRHIRDLFQKAGARQPVNRSLYVDVKSYLVDNCLVKMDRMSMAVSLEARVPFLDKELVDLAFKMPDKFKVINGKTKVLLKKVASRYIPSACVYRPKEGFSIPIKQWLITELRPLMEELLNPAMVKADGLFRVDTIEHLKQQHIEGYANHSHILWSLMVFHAWRRLWLKG